MNSRNPVILSERSESKDPDNPRLTTIACTFLHAILAVLVLALTAHPAHAQGRVPHSSRQSHRRDGWDRTLFYLALLFVVAFIAASAHAQGCAQCLDSTRATPPAVQAAYRHAIYLLIGAASTIFLIGIYLLRRDP